MKVTTDTKLIFDTADENCKLVIANERATVICIDGKSKKKRYKEYWLPLKNHFEPQVQNYGLKQAIYLTMNIGFKSCEYL